MTTVLPHHDQESEAAEIALSVKDLVVSSGENQLVRGISFELRFGERVALIGESGSGKSLTSLALLALLPRGLKASGDVRLAPGDELLGASERQMARLRGSRISMVFQEPLTALNPTKRVGAQVAEVIRIHGKSVSRADAAKRAVQLLDDVRLADPEASAQAYPHQLSGGQRQRIVLAMAMANKPAVLVCDEPTTALDVTVQAQMLELIAAQVLRERSALLFITHDLAVVSGFCDRVLVMYGGTIVESGSIQEVFENPRHPYTLGLLECSDIGAVGPGSSLPTIPGSVPAAGKFPSGCVFRDRCPRSPEQCRTEPSLDERNGHLVACWHPVGGGSG